MTIEIRAPWTVRLTMSRPRSSVPSGKPSIGGDEARSVGRHRRLERTDEQLRGDREHREEHEDDDADQPFRAPEHAAGAARCPGRSDGHRSGAPARLAAAIRSGPADRGRRRSRSATRLARTTDTLRSRKTPWRTG